MGIAGAALPGANEPANPGARRGKTSGFLPSLAS